MATDVASIIVDTATAHPDWTVDEHLVALVVDHQVGLYLLCPTPRAAVIVALRTAGLAPAEPEHYPNPDAGQGRCSCGGWLKEYVDDDTYGCTKGGPILHRDRFPVDPKLQVQLQPLARALDEF